MFWVGNEYPSYTDAKGSIKRRCALFKFDNLIRERVTNLVERIKSGELIFIMLRCLKRYKERAYEILGEDWHANAPRQLIEWSNDAAVEMNPLAAFLHNGSDYYQIT